MSEPGQDLTRPATRAERSAGGWRIDGRKIFCTMSPAATTLLTLRQLHRRRRPRALRLRAGAGRRAGRARSATTGTRSGCGRPGSHSIVLERRRAAARRCRGGFATGEAVPYLDRNLPSGLFHASASLGIAEAAFTPRRGPDRVGDDARAQHARRRGGDRPRRRPRGHRARRDAGRRPLRRPPGRDGSDDEVIAVFSEGQAAKAFVVDAATRVVDRALALSGGAGYLNGSPLARAYRDVRAGAFMHPLGANRAYGFLARTALGLRPQLA